MGLPRVVFRVDDLRFHGFVLVEFQAMPSYHLRIKCKVGVGACILGRNQGDLGKLLQLISAQLLTKEIHVPW